MSRIGKKPILIPEGIAIEIEKRNIIIKGPKGTLRFTYHSNISVIKSDSKIIVKRNTNDKFSRSLHGLTAKLIKNNIAGVLDGFVKQLELKGIGYRAKLNDNELSLNLGYSHPVLYKAPEGISFQVDKNVIITISGIDKQLVGQVASEIRSLRPPEPYKGKGIRYVGETVRRKAGKATKTARK